ncbi:MAG TPA: hypothetical protein PKD09_09215 [Aggregatilinea sp.]|uniref:hypothetical protein n=1 Tax=Aggregatilinea sp. TaxID=2806333 RepID=UPI002CD2CC65|nr:hypothetical protein [Aggregatilinea sp.]HML21815.1 hypothetical protein [Aggregatilinea sp.]
MAVKTVVARNTQLAINSLEASLNRMAVQVGVDPINLAGIQYRRDPDYEAMLRYEAMAAQAAAVAAKIAPLELTGQQDVSLLVPTSLITLIAPYLSPEQIDAIRNQISDDLDEIGEDDPMLAMLVEVDAALADVQFDPSIEPEESADDLADEEPVEDEPAQALDETDSAPDDSSETAAPAKKSRKRS